MKKHLLNKYALPAIILSFLVGVFLTFVITNSQVQYQKKLTVKILKNSIGSMEAFQELSNSCSDAYKTVTACMANIKSCNFEAETKKLDEFNTRRQHADAQIELMNKDAEKIIKEVKSNQ